MSKKLHLAISALIILAMGLTYGMYPDKILPFLFDFSAESVDLKNVFRALGGLYVTMAMFWIFGLVNPKYRDQATLTIVLFMGGLAFGRAISFLIDGVSIPFVRGFIIELLLAIWGIFNLRKTKIGNSI